MDRVAVYPATLIVEVPGFAVADVSDPLIVPRRRYLKKVLVESSMRCSEVFASDPQQYIGCFLRAQTKRLEVKAVFFGVLTQQIPVGRALCAFPKSILFFCNAQVVLARQIPKQALRQDQPSLYAV